MKINKVQRETRQIEMVETHNLAVCLGRLRDAPQYDSDRWKRALVHAIGMSNVASGFEEKQKIRVALGLP